jgi:predicted secreted hydrolase
MNAAIACGAALFVCLAARAAPPPGADVLPQPAAGFAQALAPHSFTFPRDHGPHEEFRQEWWYFTGNLRSADGARFGFELTFFRFALTPPGRAAAGPSAWRARELYLAHFAITDVARTRFRAAQKLSRGALGLAGAESPPLQVWIDDWRLRAPADPAGAWQLHARQKGYELELQMTPQGAPVLNGPGGLSVKADAPGAASYYYSIPRLRVTGQLQRDGTPQAVTGEAWLDREWGSGALGAQQVGWDWFGLQLGDGSALMFYALRRTDGSLDAHSAGTYTDPQGVSHALAAQAVRITDTAHWRSADGVRYPSAWRIAVPQLALAAEITPVLADQELHTTPRYWEGAVDVHGTRAGQALEGQGYVELVGYAERAARANTGAAASVDR